MSSSSGVSNAVREYNKLKESSTGQKGLEKHLKTGKEIASLVSGQALNTARDQARSSGLGSAGALDAMNKAFDIYQGNIQQGYDSAKAEDDAKLQAAQNRVSLEQSKKAARDQQISQGLGTAASLALLATMSDARLKDYHKVDEILGKYKHD